MDTVALIIVIAVLAAVIAWLVMQLRNRDSGGAIGGTRPPKVNRRRVRASDDPMASAVASHSQAVEPQDAAAEELALRAQANRVAADEHLRQANALAGDGTDGSALQAQSHHEAAAKHHRVADDLDRGVTPPVPGSPLDPDGR